MRSFMLTNQQLVNFFTAEASCLNIFGVYFDATRYKAFGETGLISSHDANSNELMIVTPMCAAATPPIVRSQW